MFNTCPQPSVQPACPPRQMFFIFMFAIYICIAVVLVKKQ